MTRLGVVDTTFARFPMGDAAADEYRKHAGADAQVLQRTVPGIKDLAVECLNMFEQQECDLIVACGMVGGDPIDQVCAHEASTALQQVMLATRRHVLEVFVHQIEAADDNQLA